MRKSKRVTREDVARLAGVSTATVSYVINNGPRPVASDTRERILRAIAELGYYPNELARSLRIRQTLTIGVVIPDLLNPVYTGLACLLEELCFRKGYVMIVCSTNRQANKERRLAEMLRAKQVDGVVFLPDSESMDALTIFRDAHVPTVILEHDIESMPCVAIDDYRGGFIGTEHLIHLGHRQIGFIQQQPTYTTSQRRLHGYLNALHDHGIEPDRSLIVTCDSGYRGGMEAMRVLLGRVTAVFAHNDVIALGVMRAIYDARLTVPGDISVVGYDDITSSAYYMPPLTTVSYPAEAMAHSAARQLFGMLSSDHGAQRPVTEFLPVHLQVRQSTAPLTKG